MADDIKADGSFDGTAHLSDEEWLTKQYNDKEKLKADLAAAKAEIERLRKFIEFIFYENGDDLKLDMIDVFEKAKELKIVEMRPTDPETNEYEADELTFCVWTPKKGSGDG